MIQDAPGYISYKNSSNNSESNFNFKNKHFLAGVLVIALTIPLTVLLVRQQQDMRQRAAGPVPSATVQQNQTTDSNVMYTVEQLAANTNRLKSLIAEYSSADESQKANLLAQLSNVTSERKTMLLHMVQEHPSDIMPAIITYEERQKLPTNLQENIELLVEVEGMYQIDNNKRQVVKLDDGRAIIITFNENNFAYVKPGTRVRASGIKVDNWLGLTSTGGESISEI